MSIQHLRSAIEVEPVPETVFNFDDGVFPSVGALCRGGGDGPGADVLLVEYE